MTSSLVGSEMCIRDSAEGASSSRLHTDLVLAQLGPDPPAHSLAMGPLTVSYTHLTLPTICSV
eukprot:688674-Prorocentrum_lima.AAC.1